MPSQNYIKPSIGVAEFSNSLGESPRNRLGITLADHLAEELIISRRYTVFTPSYTRTLLPQLVPQGLTEKDMLYYKTASRQPIRYLIRGRITDYGVITVDGFLDRLSEGQLLKDAFALVGVTLHVLDIRSGHTIAVLRIQGKAPCHPEEIADEPVDASRAFAMTGYYRTVMGRATQDFAEKALREIRGVIERIPYQPKIASLVNDQIVINGGHDRGIKPYQRYEVRPAADGVIDPDSTEYLGYVAGQRIGVIEVTQVLRRYALARVVYHEHPLQPDQTLFLLDPEKQSLTQPAVHSQY